MLLYLSSQDGTIDQTTSSFSISTTNMQQFSKLKLKQVSIPNVQYNIPSGSDTINYKLLQTNISGSISITPGIYSESSLTTALNSAFTTAGVNITVTFNSGVNTLTFTGQQQIEFYFAESNSINPLILGFLAETYTSNSVYIITSPNAINLNGSYDTYFISITNLSCPNQAGGNFSFTFFVSVNQILGQILYLSQCESDQVVDLGQTFTMNIFKVVLRNTERSLVNLNGMNWSFVIELLL